MVTKTWTRTLFGAIVTRARGRYLLGPDAAAVIHVLSRRGLKMDRSDVFNLACAYAASLFGDLDETIDELIAQGLVKNWGDDIIQIAGGNTTLVEVRSDRHPQWFQGLDPETDDLAAVTPIGRHDMGIKWV